MFTRTAPVSLRPVLLAAAAATAAALLCHGSLAYRPAPDLRIDESDVLSWQIADQGNRALQQIRADARQSIRNWSLPALPAPIAADLAAADAS